MTNALRVARKLEVADCPLSSILEWAGENGFVAWTMTDTICTRMQRVGSEQWDWTSECFAGAGGSYGGKNVGAELKLSGKSLAGLWVLFSDSESRGELLNPPRLFG
jgi:hypothetical protein